MAATPTKTELKLAVAVLAVIAAVVLLTWQPEPSYEGRSLSAWYEDLASHRNATNTIYLTSSDPTVQRAQGAIRHIGEDALPFLVRKVQQFGVTNISKATRVLSVLFARDTTPPDPQLEFYRLGRAFQALGDKAAPAIPRLQAILPDPNKGQIATTCLGAIGPKGMVSLIQGLHHATPQVRLYCLVGLLNQGTNASQALPDVMSMLEDRDDTIRSVVPWAAMRMTKSPATVVSEFIARFSSADVVSRLGTVSAMGEFVLKDWAEVSQVAPKCVELLTLALSDSDARVRRSALYVLANCREFAVPNLPVIRALTSDPEESVRSMATNTLKRLTK